jgi:hypothetical protein
LKQKIFSHSEAEYRSTLGVDTASLLHQFPRTLRGQIVVYMHRQTLMTCELFKIVTPECAKALLLCVTPTVCLQKEVLIGRGELCEFLYVMQRGALQVRDQPASDFEEKPEQESSALEGSLIGRAVTRAVRRVSCMARTIIGNSNAAAPVDSEPSAARTSQKRVGGGPGKKGTNKFHVLERQGALVGLHDPHQASMLYPYTVIASKTASLLRIHGADLRAVLNAFGDKDFVEGRQLMNSEFDSIATSLLQGTRQSRLKSLETTNALIQHTAVLNKAPSSSPEGARDGSQVPGAGRPSIVGLPSKGAQQPMAASPPSTPGAAGIRATSPMMQGGDVQPKAILDVTRKNSLAISKDRLDSLSMDAAESEVAAERRRDQEDRQWQETMNDLRGEISSAARKLQSLMTNMGTVDAELSLLPSITNAVNALEVASSKEGLSTAPGFWTNQPQGGSPHSASPGLPGYPPEDQGSGLFGWFNSPTGSTARSANDRLQA